MITRVLSSEHNNKVKIYCRSPQNQFKAPRIDFVGTLTPKKTNLFPKQTLFVSKKDSFHELKTVKKFNKPLEFQKTSHNLDRQIGHHQHDMKKDKKEINKGKHSQKEAELTKRIKELQEQCQKEVSEKIFWKQAFFAKKSQQPLRTQSDLQANSLKQSKFIVEPMEKKIKELTHELHKSNKQNMLLNNELQKLKQNYQILHQSAYLISNKLNQTEQQTSKSSNNYQRWNDNHRISRSPSTKKQLKQSNSQLPSSRQFQNIVADQNKEICRLRNLNNQLHQNTKNLTEEIMKEKLRRLNQKYQKY